MSWKVHLTSCFFIAINLLKLFLFPWKNKGQKWEGRKTVSFIFECNFPSGERKRDLIREAFFTPGRECEAETKGRRTGRTKVIKTFLKGWKCCAFMGTEIWPFLLTCTINTLRHNAPLPYTWCLAPNKLRTGFFRYSPDSFLLPLKVGWSKAPWLQLWS